MSIQFEWSDSISTVDGLETLTSCTLPDGLSFQHRLSMLQVVSTDAQSHFGSLVRGGQNSLKRVAKHAYTLVLLIRQRSLLEYHPGSDRTDHPYPRGNEC